VTSLNPTLGQIVASVTGFKGGTSKAVAIGTLASMPELNVIKNGRIVASVQTSDLTISNASAFAIQDLSDTLKTINNAGTISATATTLNSGTQIARAIDLSLSATDNIIVNNSGIIVGEVLMGQSGNNHRLFVGNVGTVGTNTTTGFGSGGGVANSTTGVPNAPTATGAGINGPAIISGTIDFGIGGSAAAPNVLHIGGSGVVSGKIFSRGAGVLDVRVDGNGTLTVANTQETLRTRTLLINGGTRSGKEVVAFAVHKHHLGTLVGERTAGAVVGGRPFLLSDRSLLFLAVMDIQVDGTRLEGTGVEPDVHVTDLLEFDAGHDVQLDRAVEVATGLVRAR